VHRKASRQVPNESGIRKSRWAVIRNTYPQLKDTTIRTWLDWFPEADYGKFHHAPPPDHIMEWEVEDGSGKVTKVECEVLFRALDKPAQVANLLSLEITGAWINEAREVPHAIWEALDGRVGRYPSRRDGGATWKGIFMDSNPCDTDSWLYELFETKKLPGYSLWHQPAEENEDNLPKDYYHDISQGKDPEWVRIYCKGEYGFICEGKPAYPEFAHAMHVSPEPLQYNPNVPIIVGIDFGLTPAFIYTQIQPSGQWAILHEEVAFSMGIERHAEHCIKVQNVKFPGSEFQYYADPAGTSRVQTDEKTCYQILNSLGIDCTPGVVDFTSRREAVARRLTTLVGGLPGIIIDGVNCPVLVKGFLGGYYHRELGNTGRFNDVPDKNIYSHVHDALQYPATRLFEAYMKPQAPRKRARPSNWRTV
jgi:hypothetical protein